MSLDLGFDLPSRLILSKPAVLQSAVGTWTPSNSTLANNAVAAPDGTTTASTITATGASLAAAFPASFTAVANLAYAFSAYISSASGPWALLSISDLSTNALQVWFDPNGGTVGSTVLAGNGTAAGTAVIRPASGGFFLATIYPRFSAANPGMVLLACCANANGASASTVSQVLNIWHPTLQPLT